MQLPLFIWMAKDFVDDVPSELDEAAMIDGCSRLRVLWTIIIPAGRAGIIAVSILTFLFTWNDLIFPITLSASVASKTITVGITDFVTDADMLWTRMAAAGVVGAFPSLLFVLLCQKYLVKGLLEGALKG